MTDEIVVECPNCKADSFDAAWEEKWEYTPTGINTWQDYCCNCCGHVYESGKEIN